MKKDDYTIWVYLQTFFWVILVIPLSALIYVVSRPIWYIERFCGIDYGEKPWERKRLGKKAKVKVLDDECPNCGHHLKRAWWSSSKDSWENLAGREGWMTYCEHCKEINDFKLVSMN